MVQTFFQKIIGAEEQQIKTKEEIILEENCKILRIAAVLVLGISLYWLVIDYISNSYNLSIVAKIGVVLQMLFSVYMFMLPAFVKKCPEIICRLSYIFYYLIIITGMAMIILSRNLTIIASGDISNNIGISVATFYMFLLVFMPLPKLLDTVIVLASMIFGMIAPEIFAHTSTYSMFSHILLALCFSVTYYFYRKVLLAEAQREIEIARLNNILLKQSNVDALTGILNRRSMDYYMDYLKKNTVNHQLGVIFFDVDYFKKYNDHYGHIKGDAALYQIAQAALHSMDGVENGYLFRYGGEEFTVLLDGADETELIQVMRKIRDGIYDADISRTDLWDFDRITVTVGGALEALPNKTGDYAVEANTQLFVGKSSYRNGIYYQGKIIDTMTLQDQKLVEYNYHSQLYTEGFESALSNREFVLFFQPKFRTDTKEIESAEALVRWINKDGQFISPGEFIPIFEKTGQIIRLDEYVLEAVASFQKRLSEKGEPLIPISVNMSRASLLKQGEAKQYEAIVNRVGIDKQYLPIEITESSDADSSRIKNKVLEMSEMGFTVELDDFGSGYSTMSNLGTLPFHAVKLDKSLIDEIGTQNGEEVLRHTVELVHFLNMQVVAEGVETEKQFEFVKNLRCEVIQGYYFSKPLPEQDFLKLITKQI